VETVSLLDWLEKQGPSSMARVQQHYFKQEEDPDQFELTDLKLRELSSSLDIKLKVKLERSEGIKTEKNVGAFSLERAPKKVIKQEPDQIELSDLNLREWIGSNHGIDIKPIVKLERLELQENLVKKESNAACKPVLKQGFDQVGLSNGGLRERLDNINIHPVVKLKRLVILESPVEKETSSSPREEIIKEGFLLKKPKVQNSENALSNSLVSTNWMSRNINETFTDIISNGCTFKCQQCGKVFDVFGTLRIHVSKVHQQTMAKDKLTAFAVCTKFYKCIVCKEQLLCDVYLITEHLIKSHRMTLSQYCETYDCLAFCRQRLRNNNNKNFVQNFLRENALITERIDNMQ
jgi:hypothetical protein